MTLTRILPLLAVGALAADCGVPTNSTDSSTDDTFCFDCVLQVATVDATCDDGGTASDASHTVADDTVTLTMTLDAWAGSIEFDLNDTGDTSGNAWTESHLLPDTANVDFAADGSMDSWSQAFTEVTTAGAVDDTHTLLGCAWYATNGEGVLRGLAAKATVFDDASPANQADCVIWGHNASTAFAGDSCACAEDWLNPAPANPCGSHI